MLRPYLRHHPTGRRVLPLILWGVLLGTWLAPARLLAASTADIRGSARAIASGFEHTCAALVRGGVQCWGRNVTGQLGDGTTTFRYAPVDVRGLTGDVTALAAGMSHTCALLTSGGVLCWGHNGHGQLGDGTATRRLTPISVKGLAGRVTALVGAKHHTCALLARGSVQCWGTNRHGQLGDGTTFTRRRPVDVVGLGGAATALSAGYNHTCAVLTGGRAQCWGLNHNGQLGVAPTGAHLRPVDVEGLGGEARALAAGGHHTCALMTSGGVQCWGYNGYGQLGDSTTTHRYTPADVVGLGGAVTTLASAAGHTCGAMTGGGAKCWGYNPSGQLGVPSETGISRPVQVQGLSAEVLAIAPGYFHTCVLNGRGAVECWGADHAGQRGDG